MSMFFKCVAVNNVQIIYLVIFIEELWKAIGNPKCTNNR